MPLKTATPRTSVFGPGIIQSVTLSQSPVTTHGIQRFCPVRSSDLRLAEAGEGWISSMNGSEVEVDESRRARSLFCFFMPCPNLASCPMSVGIAIAPTFMSHGAPCAPSPTSRLL